jgi:hypothetical protein
MAAVAVVWVRAAAPRLPMNAAIRPVLSGNTTSARSGADGSFWMRCDATSSTPGCTKVPRLEKAPSISAVILSRKLW